MTKTITFEEKIGLQKALSDRLEGKLTEKEIMDHTWGFIDRFNGGPGEAAIESEKTFWQAIWTVHHLGDDDHMSNAAIRKQLEDLLHSLDECSLPNEKE